MISIRFWAGILIGVSALFYSCDRIGPPPKAPEHFVPLSPGRDEVYVFSLGRLSMSAFEHLRKVYPDVSSTDLVRLAMTAQWLQARATGAGAPTLQETTRCVRAMFQPAVSERDQKSAVDFLSRHFSIPSLEALTQAAHDAEGGWRVEWNPALVREYGISIR